MCQIKLREQLDGGLRDLLSLWERPGEGAMRLLLFGVGVGHGYLRFISEAPFHEAELKPA